LSWGGRIERDAKFHRAQPESANTGCRPRCSCTTNNTHETTCLECNIMFSFAL
jgi:hypothetical protein